MSGASQGAAHADGDRCGTTRLDHPLGWELGERERAAIGLTIAEATRLDRLARQYAAGLITRARLAFHLQWSRWRRRHQARARWHHHSARLLAAAAT
jgi:hypothetical protein